MHIVDLVRNVFTQIVGWAALFCLLICIIRLAKKGWTFWRRADLIDALVTENLEKIKAAELSPYVVADYISRQWANLPHDQLQLTDKLREQFEDLVFSFYIDQNGEILEKKVNENNYPHSWYTYMEKFCCMNGVAQFKNCETKNLDEIILMVNETC